MTAHGAAHRQQSVLQVASRSACRKITAENHYTSQQELRRLRFFRFVSHPDRERQRSFTRSFTSHLVNYLHFLRVNIMKGNGNRSFIIFHDFLISLSRTAESFSHDMLVVKAFPVGSQSMTAKTTESHAEAQTVTIISFMMVPGNDLAVSTGDSFSCHTLRLYILLISRFLRHDAEFHTVLASSSLPSEPDYWMPPASSKTLIKRRDDNASSCQFCSR